MDVATARLQKELKVLIRNPLPNIQALPSLTNILEWHYVLRGDPDSVYAGGVYHGRIVFPREFPYKPPALYMNTPNGRFQTGCRLCLSISDFHPETWNCLLGVSAILLSLQSFFYENTPTTGSCTGVPAQEKSRLARLSLGYNVSHSVMFRKLFPELVEEYRLQKEREANIVTPPSRSVVENTQCVGMNEKKTHALQEKMKESSSAQLFGPGMILMIMMVLLIFLISLFSFSI